MCPPMGRRLPLAAAALLLVFGVACGAKTTMPRYVYYPLPTPTTEGADTSGAADVAADTQDDPAPADFVDARPATERPARAEVPPASATLNLPRGGSIAFGASGLTQVLRAPPLLTAEQRLPPAERAAVG